MEKPAGGEVSYHGQVVPPLGMRTRAQELTAMQMVFQDPNSSLNPRKRLGAQIEDGIAAARKRGAQSATPSEWLHAVGLAAELIDRYPHQLSGGQGQRVAIAPTIAPRPDPIVAHER